MDYLALPTEPCLPHLEVELYSSTEPYKCTYTPPWETFGERHGWTIAEADPNDEYLNAEWKRHIAAIMQEWLYFGLLVEFLGNRTAIIYQTTCGSDKTYISANTLLSDLEKFMLELKVVSESDRVEWETRMNNVLTRSFDIYQWVSLSTDYTRRSTLLPDILGLSIELLHNTLCLAYNHLVPSRSLPKLNAGRFLTIRNELIYHGWCPSEVFRLNQDNSTLSGYYASRLGALPTSIQHIGCTDYECIGVQVNHSTYRTRHVTKDCICTFVGPETEQVARILRSGLTPVLQVEAGAMKFVGVPLTSSNFVAISHVWADGLGNQKTNKLPICQLERIQRCVDDLHRRSVDTNLFWMDTICVPVGESFRNERDIAIKDMVNIYRQARCVLIFNGELSEINSKRSKSELAVRVCRTSWFRRLWTLHEGVLANDMYFQLLDTAIHFQDLMEFHDNCTSIGVLIEQRMLSELRTPLGKLLRFRDRDTQNRITHIWEAVQWRMTSRSEDETICLANMLGLSLDTIVAIPWDHPNIGIERMKAFVLAQKSFPSESLFHQNSEGTNLTDPGFRWAPRSFVFRQTGSQLAEVLSTGDRMAMATPKGLVVALPGLVLDWKDLHPKDSSHRFVIPGDWDHWYKVQIDDEDMDWNAVSKSNTPAIILQDDIFNVSESYLRTHASKGFIGDLMESGDVDAMNLPSVRNYPNSSAVLVAIQSIESNVIYCDYIKKLLVLKNGYFRSTLPAQKQIFGSDKAQLLLDSIDVRPRNQSWCVG